MNNKISDTTKRNLYIYIHRSTGGDSTTVNASYCGPKTQIAKKCKTVYTILERLCCPKLWAALQVKDIDLKEQGLSGM